ncbi:hypothetical protein KUTeg_022123 [Tegillarca granosa]|uniref:BTBD8 BACK domain-containing protein n=1 Tax=Tegillarca granosa TaxID=220873 RepID=A0ABQ9E5B9_TEGGR|nr:hypothetical protein KUTeg_022123 [Tegillarca granosa]
MARPKEKAIKDQTRNLEDRGNRTKNKIKIALATQLRNDIGRSMNIYSRLLELAGISDQEDNVSILNMPEWLEYNTMKELLRQLYTAMPLDTFVDEVDEKYETLLKDNLLEQLLPRKQTPCDAETVNPDNVQSDTTKPIDSVQNTDSCNHDNIIQNREDNCNDIDNENIITPNSHGDTHAVQNEHLTGNIEVETKSKENSCVLNQNSNVSMYSGHDIPEVPVDNSAVGNDTAGVDKIEGNNNIDMVLPSRADNTCIVNDNVTMVTDNSNIQKINSEKGKYDLKSDDTVDQTESGDLQPSLCDIIKLSYNISIPYETCSELGEDLLRGYLQEMDYDCVISVSGTHFKAHKITPGVMEQILLYLYGGVIELNETCFIGELVMAADMYGIEGMKDVVNFTLTKQFCHFFHKTVNNVLEVMLDCQQLNRVIPHVRWSEPTLCAVTKVMDKAIEFTSQNFIKLLTSSKFVHASRGLAYQMGLLEEIFEIVVKSIPISSACEIYLEIYNRQPQEDLDDNYLERTPSEVIKDLKEDKRFMSTKSDGKTRSLKHSGSSLKSTSADSQSKSAQSNNQPNVGYPSNVSRKTTTSSYSLSPVKSKISSVANNRTGLLKKTMIKSLRRGDLSGASTESLDGSAYSDGWSSSSSLDLLGKGASSFGNHGNSGDLRDFDVDTISSVYDDVADNQSVDCEVELQLMNFITDAEFAEPKHFLCELIPLLEFNFLLPDN